MHVKNISPFFLVTHHPLDTPYYLVMDEPQLIVVTYEIRVFFEGAQKEVFSSIKKKHYKNTKA
jgi:hypothetical protein